MSPLVLPMLLVLHAAPPSVVAPDWKTVQVPNELADFYAEHFAQGLRHAGLKVVTSAEVSALLSMERQKQLLGCAGEGSSCLAELGAAMGCDAVLLATLAKLEDTYQGNLKIIRATDGKVLAETRVEATGQKALLDALDAAVPRLTAPLLGKKPPAEQPVVEAPVSVEQRGPSRGTKRLWWIPAVVGGVGAVTGLVGLFAAWFDHEAMLSAITQGKPLETAQGYKSAGEGFQTAAWVGGGVAVAGLVGAGVTLLFGSEPAVVPSVGVSPAGATLTLGGRF